MNSGTSTTRRADLLYGMREAAKTARGGSQHGYADRLEQGADEIERLNDALLAIRQNAESWHGPPPADSGHVRSLAVIASTARRALGESESVDE